MSVSSNNKRREKEESEKSLSYVSDTSTPKSSSKKKKFEEKLKEVIEPEMRKELTKLLKSNAEKQAALGGDESIGVGDNINNRNFNNQSGSGETSEGDDGSMDNSFGSSNGNRGNSKSLKERGQEINKFRKDAPEKMRNLRRNSSERVGEIKQNARNQAEKLKKLKKISKDDMNKAIALKKAALKKQLALHKKNLKKNLKKKIRISAKYGKNPYMSCLFIIMMFLAFVNDVLLDIVVGSSIQLVGLIISLTGVGAAVGAPVIAFISAASKIIDAITGVILTVFSLITGGATKASMNKQVFSLLRLGAAVVVEEIDVINLAPSWIIVIAINWMIMRRDATKAEEA